MDLILLMVQSYHFNPLYTVEDIDILIFETIFISVSLIYVNGSWLGTLCTLNLHC